MVKETQAQIQKHLNSYPAEEVKSLFFIFAKFVAINEDFRVIVNEDFDEVKELIHEEVPGRIVFDLESELTREDILLLEEIMEIEIYERKVTKKKAVELMSQVMANDVLFEGMCMGVSSPNEMLAHMCESFGCKNRFALLLEDEVFCRRREYFLKIYGYTKAATNLYGVIFIKELLHLIAAYEQWPAKGDAFVKKSGTYRTTLFYSPEYYSLFVLHHVVGDDIPEVVTSPLGYVLNMVFREDVMKEMDQMTAFGRQKKRELTETDLDELHKLTANSEYRILHETAQDKEMYLPDKDTFLRYADDWYYEESPAVIRFQKYMKDRFGKQLQSAAKGDFTPEDAAEELAYSIQLKVKDICNAPGQIDPGELAQFALTEMTRYGLEMKSIDEINEFLGYLMDLANSTRLWTNHGHTPSEILGETSRSTKPITIVPNSSNAAEILQKADEQLREMGVQVDLDSNATEVPTYTYRSDSDGKITKSVKKVYPNDPCPCGSGKKYKKCCGK